MFSIITYQFTTGCNVTQKPRPSFQSSPYQRFLKENPARFIDHAGF
jgi:hypothetical protein